jgi:hypothetical protein
MTDAINAQTLAAILKSEAFAANPALFLAAIAVAVPKGNVVAPPLDVSDIVPVPPQQGEDHSDASSVAVVAEEVAAVEAAKRGAKKGSKWSEETKARVAAKRAAARAAAAAAGGSEPPKEKRPTSPFLSFQWKRVAPLLDEAARSQTHALSRFAGQLWSGKALKEWSDEEITSAWAEFQRTSAPAPKPKKMPKQPKKPLDRFLESWLHEGQEFLKNERGDVLNMQGDWVGHWDGTSFDFTAPEPEDFQQLTTRD